MGADLMLQDLTVDETLPGASRPGNGVCEVAARRGRGRQQDLFPFVESRRHLRLQGLEDTLWEPCPDSPDHLCARSENKYDPDLSPPGYHVGGVGLGALIRPIASGLRVKNTHSMGEYHHGARLGFRSRRPLLGLRVFLEMGIAGVSVVLSSPVESPDPASSLSGPPSRA
jgi:hypothetical protein